jgi:hypothetical protein
VRKKLTAHEAALAALKEAQENGDTGSAHCHADAALCDLLTTLGYADVVAEYHKVDKWFA